MDGFFDISFFQSIIRLTTPILLASLGCMFTARVGIINFAMEGIMLMGAFGGYYGSYLMGDPFMGLIFGMGAGVLTALILGVTSINAGVDQVVAGTGINIFAIGMSGFLLNSLFGREKPRSVDSLQDVVIPYLSDIPYIGKILFQQNMLVYMTFIIIPVCWYVIFHTPFGLSMRAVGENPRAADSVGVNVNRIKYAGVVLSGMLGGLGGACLSIVNLSVFMENMVSGRGYLAWSTVTVGKWNPFGILAAAGMFGSADALQLRMQIFGIQFPYQILLMFPYILTMLVLAGVVGKTIPPASMGRPYKKEQH